MSRARDPVAPVTLPADVIRPWDRLIDEVSACLADDTRSRGGLNDMVDACSRVRPWPIHSLSDEYMLSSFLSAVMSFATATARRRAWLGNMLQVLKDGVEGQVGLCSPLTSSTARTPSATAPTSRALPVSPTAWPSPPRSSPPRPGPGEPGFRPDIDG